MYRITAENGLSVRETDDLASVEVAFLPSGTLVVVHEVVANGSANRVLGQLDDGTWISLATVVNTVAWVQVYVDNTVTL